MGATTRPIDIGLNVTTLLSAVRPNFGSLQQLHGQQSQQTYREQQFLNLLPHDGAVQAFPILFIVYQFL